MAYLELIGSEFKPAKAEEGKKGKKEKKAKKGSEEAAGSEKKEK
jgi:hypothetical protein